MTNPETFTFTVRSEGRWQAPVECRLRSFLKMALRGYGLRCVGMSAGGPPGHPGASTQAPGHSTPQNAAGTKLDISTADGSGGVDGK